MQFTTELSDAENTAVEIIKTALRANFLPDEPLFFRRTEKYLTVGGNDYHPFARLKLEKKLWYVALSCGDPQTGRSFQRFAISNVHEIEKYSSEIAQAFRFSNPAYTEHHFADLRNAELNSEMREFFSKMETSTSSAQQCDLNASEITFFTAYVEALKSAGLNWRNANPIRSSDGGIGVRGGSIRLRSKNIQFKYWPSGNPIGVWEKGITLAECISKINYWVDDCLKYKDIYEM